MKRLEIEGYTRRLQICVSGTLRGNARSLYSIPKQKNTRVALLRLNRWFSFEKVGCASHTVWLIHSLTNAPDILGAVYALGHKFRLVQDSRPFRFCAL